jgi:hypothetical protein
MFPGKMKLRYPLQVHAPQTAEQPSGGWIMSQPVEEIQVYETDRRNKVVRCQRRPPQFVIAPLATRDPGPMLKDRVPPNRS